MPKILPVFIPFSGCKSKCVYCNQNIISGQKIDNLKNDVLKQIEFHFNICSDWDEISYFGGSFSCLSESTRNLLYNIAKEKGFKTLRFSTRPDCLKDEMIDEFKKNYVKTIELGVQSLSDEVLLKNNRPYSASTTIEWIDKLHTAGFNVVAQIMVGMYGENWDDFKFTVDTIAEKKVNGVRIYPTVVLNNTMLKNLYDSKDFIPLDFEDVFSRLIYAFVKFSAKGIEILRIGLQDSESLKKDIAAGLYYPAFGDMVKTLIIICYIKQFGKLSVREEDIKKLPNYKGILKKYFSDKIISVNNSEEFSIKDICAKLEIITGEDNWGQSEREVAKFAKEIWSQTDDRPA
ncbi:MAG: hypothetical protein PWQ25_1120 [Deferribacteres bacterium]|nr:hypothetical protein [Deferribacteres bacterium]